MVFGMRYVKKVKLYYEHMSSEFLFGLGIFIYLGLLQRFSGLFFYNYLD